MVSEKVIQEFLKNAESAADAAEAAATRLQQKTSQKSLDRFADNAKETIHDVREAIEDLNDVVEQPGELPSEKTSKIVSAAAAVEAELQEIAQELAVATENGAQNQNINLLRKSTLQAVRELELLAEKRAGKSIQGRTVFIALWALWLLSIIIIIYTFDMTGKELALGGIVGFLWGIVLAGAYYVNKQWKAERTQRVCHFIMQQSIFLMHIIPYYRIYETDQPSNLSSTAAGYDSRCQRHPSPPPPPPLLDLLLQHRKNGMAQQTTIQSMALL